MKVVLFGASGMLGHGALLECLDHPSIDRVLVVGRTSCGVQHAKLDELIHDDFLDFSAIRDRLTGYDACFWCLGITSAGRTEAEYARVTVDYTKAGARVLVERNPAMTMCFVSGAGTDATEKSTTMWQRVKGAGENAVKAAGFRRAFLFRPGAVRPLRGVRSKTPAYRWLYTLFTPVFLVLRVVAPATVTTTVELGRAMIAAARGDEPGRVVESRDLRALAART